MITIKALTGPHKGKARVAPEWISPEGILKDFSANDWRWEIDFSKANMEEEFVWGRADMVARIMAALTHGRKVWFKDVEYYVEKPEDLLKIVGEVEDAIVDSASDDLVRVGSDTAGGVTIEVGGKVQ